ncbi:MAG: hypothetical protein MI745_12965 [Pseudomonadales bacterium]|nr:hypothetical protein [Pseudomonadales bacterium]
MNEAQRQSYLKALGLTPWVARGPLPGAAPSPLLDWPDPDEDVQPAAPEPATARPVEPAPAETPAPEARQAPPVPPERVAPPEPAEPEARPSPSPRQGQGLTFTLEAHLGSNTWLLCAQEDSQAPGLGRFEAPLMANLLALFQGRPKRPRRFFCPLTEQPMQAEEASQALSAFVTGLCEQAGGERVLLCLPESLGEALFGQPRYQPFELGGRPALVISSLAEMLAEPGIHKKASWQAMQEHGFHGD